MFDGPDTQFTELGGDLIAYQVLGNGPVDLLYVPVSGDCIDLRWYYPAYAAFLSRLASFSRLIMFDQCGMGASDYVSGDVLPSWERWADEAQAVMEAANSERAIVFGWADSGPTAMLFAALHPERTVSLILGNTTARYLPDGSYPGLSESGAETVIRAPRGEWQTGEFTRRANPKATQDPTFLQWHSRNIRLSMTPREVRAHFRWVGRSDVRGVLPSISVPTLVIHREHAPVIPMAHGMYIAEHVPGARFAVVPGLDSSIWTEPNEEVINTIAEFATGSHQIDEPDRVLAAVLFTDIVGSTEQAASMGDRRWKGLLDSHDAVASTLIEQYRGRLIKLTGDGILATFDGPGRAIRYGFALRDALQPLGITIRAGLHTGEVERRGDDIGGIGVHVAARVLESAQAGEVLTSSAVPVLVAGSGLEFEDRGEHELKGVPGTWRLFAVEG